MVRYFYVGEGMTPYTAKQIVMFFKMSWAIAYTSIRYPGTAMVLIPDYDKMTVRIEPQ